MIAELAELLPRRVEQHHGPGPRIEELRNALAALTRGHRRTRLAALVEAAAQTVLTHLELTYQPGLLPQEQSRPIPT